MIVKYNKISSNKDEKQEIVKLHFEGMFDGLKVELKISGDVEDIINFSNENKLTKFGERLEFEVENKQTTLD